MPRRRDRSLHTGKTPLKTLDFPFLFQIHLFLRQRIPVHILFILTQQGPSLDQYWCYSPGYAKTLIVNDATHLHDAYGIASEGRLV